MRKLIYSLLCCVLITSAYAQDPVNNGPEDEQVRRAFLLEVDGIISPAVTDYLERSMDRAVDAGAEFIIIRIDTPGGLDLSMRKIIKKIIASPVPVITYVSPGGSRAASAGTYILYASHVAAMTPATNLGAATPVQIMPTGGFKDDKPSPDDEPEPEGKEKKSPAVASDAMTKKIINDAVAYIQGLAELRGRNAKWAEQAVRDGVSITAEEALKKNVIDLIATDQADLFKQLDGRKVNVLGAEKTLITTGIVLEEITPDWRNKLLAVITNPNIAYILMLVGIYGLIFEFSNPGAVVPGTVGAICLLLALFAFQVLPINYAGLALILLGMGLMTAEAFAPSFGVLGLGGVVAFVLGSVILVDTELPGYGINVGLIAGFAVSTAALLILVLGLVFKARHHPIVSGQEEMIGASGEVLETFEQQGRVRVHSEIWTARSDLPMQKGERIRVREMDGLTLIVTPNNTQEKSS